MTTESSAGVRPDQGTDERKASKCRSRQVGEIVESVFCSGVPEGLFPNGELRERWEELEKLFQEKERCKRELEDAEQKLLGKSKSLAGRMLELERDEGRATSGSGRERSGYRVEALARLEEDNAEDG